MPFFGWIKAALEVQLRLLGRSQNVPLELLEDELLLEEDEDELPLTVTVKFWVLCAPQVLV